MERKIIIIDEGFSLRKTKLKLDVYDKIYFIDNEPDIKVDKSRFVLPRFDYSKIEKLAYDLCEIDMGKVLSKHSFIVIKEPYKEAIKKNLLQIYGYYYKKAKILDLMNRFGDADITICSNYIESKEVSNCKVFNSFNTYNLQLRTLKKIFRYLLSPLSHKNKTDLKAKTIVEIDAKVKYNLFKYYFPFIKEYNILILSDANSPRVKAFINFCKKHNIKYGKYYNTSFLKTFTNILPKIKMLPLIKDLKSYLIINYLLDNVYSYITFEVFFNKNKRLEYFIMSDEFNSKSNLISFLCKKKNVTLFNFQHGGIYLANHNYGNFIVMGKWIKDYYIRNTKSEKSQFLVLGNPFINKNIGFDKSKLKKKKLDILFMGQYIFGYLTRKRKENILKCVKKLLKIPNINITIKDHPGARDKMVSKYFNQSDVIILGNNDNYVYDNYDLVLSFYSTTLIESVWRGVPSISLNFDRINGILLLEKSNTLQVNSCKELFEIVKDIMVDRRRLMELYKIETGNVKDYWNKNVDDYQKLKRLFYD